MDQLCQHRMTRSMRRVVEQHVLSQAHQTLACAVVPPIAISLQDSSAFQLRKHPVHGGLGQPQLIDQALQSERHALLGNGLQQRKQSQIWRVSIQAGSACVFAVFHILLDHIKFHFFSQFIPKKEICLTQGHKNA